MSVVQVATFAHGPRPYSIYSGVGAEVLLPPTRLSCSLDLYSVVHISALTEISGQ